MLRNLFLGVLFGTIAFAAPASNSPLGAMGAKGSATTLSLPMQRPLDKLPQRDVQNHRPQQQHQDE